MRLKFIEPRCEEELSMPIRRKAVNAGVFNRAQLELLGRVFDQLKVVDDRSPEAQGRLASRIIANYMAGVTDEAELMLLSKQPLGR